MDIYHIWADLKPGVADLSFAQAVEAYLGHLQAADKIVGYRLTRRKLGLSTVRLGEWHVEVYTNDLAQLEQTFLAAASRTGEVEKLHAAVYQSVANVEFALYRDFPDMVRQNIVIA